MTSLITEEEQKVQEKELHDDFLTGSWMPLLFLGMFIISIVGNFVFDGRWMTIIMNHLFGLGIVGLFACLTGLIARKKGKDHRKAFFTGTLLPIFLGIAVFILVYISADMIYCGGGIVLLASILIVITYSLTKKEMPVSSTSKAG